MLTTLGDTVTVTKEKTMQVKRKPVSKHSSASAFRHNAQRTPMLNVINPMRGGWRL